MEDEKTYKIIELVGSSPNSWEEAVQGIVAKASKSIRDLRIAEVIKLDVRLEDGMIKAYRARVKISFKLEEDE
jgi:flavin-binding protein dodecin